MALNRCMSATSWRLWGFSALVWLLVLMVLMPWGSRAQPPAEPPPNPSPVPLWTEEAGGRLTTAPNGVFNRVAAEMVRRREAFLGVGERIEEASRRLEDLRRGAHGGRVPIENLREASGLLASMHRAVDELTTQTEDARRFLETDVAPNLGAMAGEVRTEIAALDPSDPRRERLDGLARFLEAAATDPNLLMATFERRGGGWGEAPSGQWAPGPRGGFLLMRRLERLEAQQERLRAQIEDISREIRRLRSQLETLPPEELERLEQSLPPEQSWRHRAFGPQGPPALGPVRPGEPPPIP